MRRPQRRPHSSPVHGRGRGFDGSACFTSSLPEWAHDTSLAEDMRAADGRGTLRVSTTRHVVPFLGARASCPLEHRGPAARCGRDARAPRRARHVVPFLGARASCPLEHRGPAARCGRDARAPRRASRKTLQGRRPEADHERARNQGMWCRSRERGHLARLNIAGLRPAAGGTPALPGGRREMRSKDDDRRQTMSELAIKACGAVPGSAGILPA